MNESGSVCPKCGGNMEQGYLPDASHGATILGRWAKGLPRRAWIDWWDGLFIKEPNRLAVLPISTFRCQTCGYLESYARDEFRPK